MHRYEEANEEFVEIFLDVLEKHFPQLQHLKFKLIFDLKKRISKGKLVLASIELTSPKIKFFSKDKVAVEGYDFILIMDQKAWDLSGLLAKERIIRHELRHVFINETGEPKIVGHEIEDFYAEVELNKDDPEWRVKLATLVRDVYEQEKFLVKEK
jgi:hypothetical protein